MKKIWKLLTVLFACVMLAFGFVACGDKGSGSSPEETIKYRLNEAGDGYILTSYNDPQKDVVIPSVYNELPVVAIGGSAFDPLGNAINGHAITSVTIPDSVKSIGSYAFHDCSSLTSVTIPDSVTSIGPSAFKDCSSLTSVTLGSGVTSIEDSMFEDCVSLTEVKISDSVTSIGNSAFGGCSSLTSITVPNGVTAIGFRAFNGCSGLTSVTLGNSVTNIDRDAFKDCNSLTGVYITDIGAWCNISFASASANPLTVAKNLYLNNELVNDLKIPDGVTSINAWAFEGASCLIKVAIPDSVKSVGADAFSACSGLESITLPFVGAKAELTSDDFRYPFGYIFGTNSYDGGTATKQNFYAFKSDRYVSSATYYIPNSLNSVTVTGGGIFYGAFSNCDGLKSVTIGNGVTSIDVGAFVNCSGLTEMTIPFTGASKTATGYKSGFGYIFGYEQVEKSEVWGGGKWHYHDSSSNRYYAYNIPESLKTVKITGDIIRDYAFCNCGGLTSITIGEAVTGIGASAFSGCVGLTSVAIPDGVTTIGNQAFEGCAGLTSVMLPDGVTSIGNSTFSNCERLTSVDIPDSVTTIGGGAFSNCSSLTSVTIPDSVTAIGNFAFYNCSSLTSVTIGDSVTSIGEDAFYNCDGLTGVTIPDSVTNIGSSAFSGCDGLAGIHITDVAAWCNIVFDAPEENPLSYVKNLYLNNELVTHLEIPDTVSEINAYAFYNCGGLTSVTIGNGVENIGKRAFYSCDNLASVTLGNAVSAIDSWAFGSCVRLVEVINNSELVITQGYENGGIAEYAKEVHTGESKVQIKDGYLFYPYYSTNYLFGYTGMDTEITLPESFDGEKYEIYKYAFYDYDDLTNIVVPNGVTGGIGSYAFSDCNALAEVTIGNGVKYIGSYAFQNCGKLTGVTIGNSVESIYSDAFKNCRSLKEIVVPDNVTSIVGSAFSGCSGLASVEIPDSVTSIGNCAFEGCSSLIKMTLPFVGASKNATTASNSTLFGYIFGASNYTGGTAIKQYYSSSSYAIYYIPASLKSITITGGNVLYGAFSGCSGLESVTLPDDITNIGASAFSGCVGLTGITLPDGVTNIGASAFSGCVGLTGISIPNSVASIGSYAFEECTNLTGVYIKDIVAWCNISFDSEKANPLYYVKNLYLNNDLVTKLELPDTASAIKAYAFYNYENLTDLKIENGVESIGKRAFSGCGNLTSVTMGESVTSIGEYAFSGCGLTDVYITDIAAWCNISFDGVRANPVSITKKLYLDNTVVTKLEIPDTTTEIKAYVFYNCDGFTSVTIGKGVTSIGDYAFYNNAALTEINYNATECKALGFSDNYTFYDAGQNGAGIKLTIGKNVKTLPANLFDAAGHSWGAPKITSVVFEEESVCERIGYDAFFKCETLRDISMPDSVTSIGDSAFYDCVGLTSIEIPDGVTSIGNAAFSGCSGLQSVIIPSGVTRLADNLFNGCSKLASVTLPNRITSIGSAVFFGCSSLTDIVIPETVEDLGDSVFEGCSSLTKINLPEKISVISYKLFRNCSSLGGITIPKNVVSIWMLAFEGCTSLKGVYFDYHCDWVVYGEYTASGQEIYSFGVNNSAPAALANLLTKTYKDYRWQRND